ncbi:SCO2400 family protein [Streptomyces sp. SP18CS02]|uniref:SCO2400 family protein n=1 Tax=Streptomyces sp. SP18CS02 TaxID=3002531 RepID=UPI002E784757|nr:hypothetical protein [Streptomyces sp. SP18CS02]MEE1753348.1 hypothetical protein [Streptomyces sp. SP18CS02]
MDYCHQCQRHLNGALACAGCGTPIEELRHDDPQTSAAGHVYELELDEELPSTGHRRARAQQGGRARRSGARRARKRTGRKVLIGVFGLVLAAGALSLAELAIEHPGEEGAATAVRQDGTLELDSAPEPSGGTVRPDGPGPVEESASGGSGSADPSADAGEGDGSGEGEGEAEGPASASGPPGASASASPGQPGTGPSSSAPAPDEPAPDNPGEPGPTGDTDDPAPTDPGPQPPQPPPPAQTQPPAPSPSETCDWFLWWCV